MSLRVLTLSDVDKIASALTPLELQTLMARVFHSLSVPASQAQAPPRITLQMAHHTALFMPARLVSSLPPSEIDETAIKVASVSHANNTASMKGIPASTLVINDSTGGVKALVNAKGLTAIRNAAGSLLSTNLIGMHEPISITAFGAGKQIEAHIDLFLRFYPSIRSCTIVNRSLNSRVSRLRTTFEKHSANVAFQFLTFSDEDLVLRTAIANAHVIICATSSTSPLFPSSWVRAGTHVILVGSYTPTMHECDTELIHRAVRHKPAKELENAVGERMLLVDSREACEREAGELIAAQLNFAEDVQEIGQLVKFHPSGEILWPQKLEDDIRDHAWGQKGITMFKSVGVGLQDVAIACLIVAKAEEKDIGTKVDGYDA